MTRSSSLARRSDLPDYQIQDIIRAEVMHEQGRTPMLDGKPVPVDPDPKRYCNCALCRVLLLSYRQRHRCDKGEQVIYARVNGRPYCYQCTDKMQRRFMTKKDVLEIMTDAWYEENKPGMKDCRDLVEVMLGSKLAGSAWLPNPPRSMAQAGKVGA